MPKTKEQKQEIINGLKETFKKQKSAILIDFNGLDAKALFELRRKFKEIKGRFQVVKKTLLEQALKNLEEKNLIAEIEKIDSQLAIASSFEEETLPAKVCYEFLLKNENLQIIGGIFGNEFMDTEKVVELAKLPPKSELLGTFIRTLQNPILKFTRLCEGNLKKIIYILSQIKTV